MEDQSDQHPGRFEAPVGYLDVRTGYNTTRAIGGVAIVLFAVSGLVGGLDTAPFILAAGAVLLGDAIARRHHGQGALPLLLTDVTVIGAMLLVRGHSAPVEVACVLYVLTSGMLLLSMTRTAIVLGYTMVWIAAVAIMAPLIDADVSTTRAGVFETITIGVLTTIVAQLLYGAVQALHAATIRHRTALNSERRAVRLKNEFVSMVSHELRTPLTSIAGFTDTLRESWRDLSTREIEEFLVIMRHEATHLSNLVEDVLVIPRLEAGQLRLEYAEFDLAGVLQDTSRLVFSGADQEYNGAIPTGVILNADPGRVRQIIRNLLENARKYGGDQVLVEGEARGDRYMIVISDNGPGVREEDRERIFEHFEQATKGDARSNQGVGLGLPIARKLARAMGGDLWFEPRFPTGSRFCFTVNLVRVTHDARIEQPPVPSDIT